MGNIDYKILYRIHDFYTQSHLQKTRQKKQSAYINLKAQCLLLYQMVNIAAKQNVHVYTIWSRTAATSIYKWT